MRGLDDGGVDGERAVDGGAGGTRGGTARGAAPKAAGVTAVAGLAALGLFVAGCSTGGTGSRDEGAARSDAPAAASLTPSVGAADEGSAKEAGRVDPIALLKGDPKIGARLKADLKPCVADAYPVDTSYGDLTGGAAPDVVVNVMTCGDAVGIGTYVYRKRSAGSAAASGTTTAGGYENVFMAEDAAVYGTIDRGDLIVTKQVYAEDDPVAYPSGEDVITYRWSGNQFTRHDWVHNEYSRAVGEGDGPTEAPQPVPSQPAAG
ncbi:hypothetical protein ACFFSH_20095 [Streptomyces filamentosus]|uniref:Lipoprotein CseA n=1 Tax=Streptomyces filamentosus TaxID=67294 RepID=A0A919BKE3_STRFL|nr:hypothetical protein CP979_16000 [Streptomyces filamentosus]GHF96549.1 lipoprotein CseA [Streptomyces filamentosus]